MYEKEKENLSKKVEKYIKNNGKIYTLEKRNLAYFFFRKHAEDLVNGVPGFGEDIIHELYLHAKKEFDSKCYG